MQTTGAAPREISYSFAAQTRAGRAVIRSIENITGRPRLLRMALGYEHEVAAGRDFWEVMRERYGIGVEATGLGNIPREGPLVVVANHPYGILDGLALGNILSTARGGDFRIIAHVVFRRAKDLERVILPIDFGATREAQRVNLETRRVALDYLAQGGAIGIFPGGTVSTAATPFSRPLDPHWKTFTAKMIARSDAAVVPVFFEGQNSRLFQIASHLNPTLRVALLINEFGSRVGGPIRVHVGKPLPRAGIAALRGDARALMDHLRRATYALDPSPEKDFSHGLYLG
ncbi:lysophospholipid acyltransferase family protein [Limibaculum sp. FT325]|uniref:lysophospholipid acyltransferase family protein n=1 Tax=Thermohalobaculum sediminis TaxID=2939436 RepID=UPI0020BEEB04|nr:lysophospholipid acyltransferase family protein [Limibaculum sediminis]MCL5777280.1 lysophospholipid acyltransferase family protein [Limibaculum sediminis]